MVLFRGGGDPAGVTAPERPAVGVELSGELRFVSLMRFLPSGRGLEGSEMFQLARSPVGAEAFFGPVVSWWPLCKSDTMLLPTR
jgi:hypothetical protein